MTSFFDRARLLPPWLARCMAKKSYAVMLTNDEIAARSGLTAWQVNTISYSETWDGIDIYVLEKFLTGCRLDITKRVVWHRVQTYLKLLHSGDCCFRNLRRDREWPTFYLPLLRKFAGVK